MASKLDGQVIMREPGTIQGQSFAIDHCNNCDFFLFDNSAQIFLDFCTNCRFFIGPCESSIFVRTCQNCKLICASQQFRLRDCKNCDFLLYSATRPVLENSSGIRVGCFQFSYFSLPRQFQASNLSVWNNRWSEWHDFTPREGEVHFSFLPENIRPFDLVSLDALPPVLSISPDEFKAPSFVPLSIGARFSPESHPFRFFVLCYGPQASTSASQLFSATSSQLPSIQLQRSCEIKMPQSSLQRLFSSFSQAKSIIATAVKFPLIGMELVSSSATTADNNINVETTLISLSSAADLVSSVFVSPNQEKAHTLLEAFFKDLQPSDQI